MNFDREYKIAIEEAKNRDVVKNISKSAARNTADLVKAQQIMLDNPSMARKIRKDPNVDVKISSRERRRVMSAVDRAKNEIPNDNKGIRVIKIRANGKIVECDLPPTSDFASLSRIQIGDNMYILYNSSYLKRNKHITKLVKDYDEIVGGDVLVYRVAEDGKIDTTLSISYIESIL